VVRQNQQHQKVVNAAHPEVRLCLSAHAPCVKACPCFLWLQPSAGVAFEPAGRPGIIVAGEYHALRC
jgi:hypothetical protein